MAAGRRSSLAALALAGALGAAVAAEAPRARWRVPPAPVLSPADEAKTLRLQDGFALELVASEPMVQDPVALTFDEDGRMWVVEMRGLMNDVDARGEDRPVGRVSILEDTDGDGRADRSTVFLDGLVMPRAIAVVRGGALVAHGGKLWFAEDRDGDGRADAQTVIDPDYVKGKSPEHQANGLMRAMDNWIYSAGASVRFRRAGGRWTGQATEFRGQWGLAQDDLGRLYYDYNYDQLRADLVPPNTMNRNPHHPSTRGINVQVTADQRVFPARITTGVNRGYRPDTLDADGRLLAFTSASAPLVYRGSAWPERFRGDVFVCEPAANLIKRDVVRLDGLTWSASFPYEGREWMAGTDERFRPVNVHAAPDGTVYVVDLYRGMIQHPQHMTPYLRQEVLSRRLDEGIHLGRIWRVLGPERRRGPRPRLGAASTAQLVATLAHRDGWWRDTAQRLLIERGLRDAIPALLALALAPGEPVPRVHALWTLEGLGLDAPERLLPLVGDPAAPVRIAATRVLESLAATRPPLGPALLARLLDMPADAPVAVQLQTALTAGALASGREALPLLARVAARHGAEPSVRDAVLAGVAGRELDLLRAVLPVPAFCDEASGLAPMLQALAGAIVRERRPERVEALLALAAEQRATLGWRRKPLLAGVVENMVDLEVAPVRLARKPPAWEALAAAPEAARVFPLLAWPGHAPPPAPVTREPPLAGEALAVARSGEQAFQNVCAPCHGVKGEGVEPLAPPLVGSEWLKGPPERAVLIVMFGLDGPVHVRGERYEPPRVMPNMPAVEGLPDETLHAILSYARRTFGRGARAAPIDLIREVRDRTRDRHTPYTEAELQQIAWPSRQATEARRP